MPDLKLHLHHGKGQDPLQARSKRIIVDAYGICTVRDSLKTSNTDSF